MPAVVVVAQLVNVAVGTIYLKNNMPRERRNGKLSRTQRKRLANSSDR